MSDFIKNLEKKQNEYKIYTYGKDELNFIYYKELLKNEIYSMIPMISFMIILLFYS